MQKLSPVYLEFAFGPNETQHTFTLPENGWAKVCVIQNPTFTNDITSKLSIVDPCTFLTGRSVALFTSADVANGATYKVGDDITANEPGDLPMDKTYTATVTLSGVPGGTGGTVFVAMYLKH